MAAFEQTRILNPEYNIKWHFSRNNSALNGLDSKRSARNKYLLDLSNVFVDRLVDQLERKDTPVVKAVSYGLCSAAFLYFAGNLLRAAF